MITTMAKFVIGGAALFSILLTKYLPVTKNWWQFFKVNPFGAKLLIIYFISLIFLVGQRTGTDLIDTSRYIRIVVILLLVTLSLVGLATSGKKAKASYNNLIWYFVYVMVAMATSIYSLNPLLTLWKAIEVLAGVLVALYIARKTVSMEDGQALLNFVWLLHLFLVLSAFWGWVIYPTEASSVFVAYEAQNMTGAFTSGIQGLFPMLNPNTLTQIAATLVMVLLSLYLTKLTKKEKLVIKLLLGLSVLMMLLAHSRTSIISLVGCLIIYALFTRSKAGKFILTSVVAAVIVGLPAVLTYFFRGQTEDQFMTMTGRVDLWSVVFDKFMESPAIGYGFYSASGALFGIPGADNTYLTVLLGGGILLTTIFCIPILMTALKIFNHRPTRLWKTICPEYKLFWFQVASLFVFLFLRSITGPSFDAHHICVLIYVVCLINANLLSIAVRAEKEKKEKNANIVGA